VNVVDAVRVAREAEAAEAFNLAEVSREWWEG